MMAIAAPAQWLTLGVGNAWMHLRSCQTHPPAPSSLAHLSTYPSSPRVAALHELQGRNKILASLCPQICGLFPVKLATMLMLVGGVARVDSNSSHVRGDVHMLIVGDPGTGEEAAAVLAGGQAVGGGIC